MTLRYFEVQVPNKMMVTLSEIGTSASIILFWQDERILFLPSANASVWQQLWILIQELKRKVRVA